MNAKIIIGSNYGDEGKGTVVASCALNARGKVLNVLTNGGAQRGHSIIRKDGSSITYRHFGSATLEGADNYFFKTFILNPIQFVIDCEDLHLKIDDRKIYCSNECRFTTPFDSIANLIMEHRRSYKKHGSCGMGIWNTVKRYTEIKNSLSFKSFCELECLNKLSYLNNVKEYYEKILGTIESEFYNIWNSDRLLSHFLDDINIMTKYITFINDSEAKIYFNKIYTDILFENGQGLLLNDTGKDIAGTTPSNTTAFYAINAINNIFTSVDSVEYRYVTRTYLTRHGNGEMQSECDRSKISNDLNEDRTNHYNESQGEFRYGILDVEKLKERILVDYNTSKQLLKCNNVLSLDVTHCDEIDREKEFKKAFNDNHIYTYSSPIISHNK